MISCLLFLFLQSTKSYLPVNSECACFFNQTDNETVCNLTCRQQLVEPDYLYMCPSKAFQQRLPFWRWILVEMFCISKDRRSEVVENYQPSPNVNYDTPPASISNQQDSTENSNNGLSYGSPILITNQTSNSTFSYPVISISSSICGKTKEAKFLVPSSMTCYYKNNTDSENIIDRFIGVLKDNSNIIGGTEVKFVVDDVNSTNSNAYLLNDRISTYAIDTDLFVSSIDIRFYTNGMNITEANVTIERKSTIDYSAGFFPLTVNIDYINQHQSINRTYLKSGNFGYAIGEPVIVLQKGSNQEEPFPVPYGIDGDDNYTPLLFGVDVISGFSNENLSFFSDNNRFQMSILAQGNPEYSNDWIDVSPSSLSINFYHLQIYYAKIGNVNNPQNIIKLARLYTPTKREQRSQFIFKCTFLKIANNPSKRYLQPNPQVKRLPPDTFYPFSSIDVD